MEQLEYLIRTLTYKRSCLELEWKKLDDDSKLENQGTRTGLNFALTEIYKLVGEMDHPNPSHDISDHEIVDNPNG